MRNDSRINYSDRRKAEPYFNGVNAKWLEGYTLAQIIELITGVPDDDAHTHINLDVLDLLGVDSNGKLTFDGKEIVTNGSSSGADASYISATQVIETLNRCFVTSQQKDCLSGLTDNVQMKINEFSRALKDAMVYKGVVKTYADISLLGNGKDGWTVFVESDEKNDGAKSIYVYKEPDWVCVRSDKPAQGWVAQTTAPTNTQVLWIDTSDLANITIKWHNGIAWKEISGGGGGAALPISAKDVKEEKDLRFITDAMKALLSKMSEDPSSKSLVYNGVLLGGGGTGASIDDANKSTSTTYSSEKLETLLAGKQAKLAYAPENPANKNKANGYVGLDNLGKVAIAQLPDEALYKTYHVTNATERIALTNVKTGDLCYETATGKYYLMLDKKWIYLADALKTQNSAINNLAATKSPLDTDDETAGYTVGSIWINNTTKESFICTDATASSAKWDLMGGQVNLNVCEIIPFVYDETHPGRVDGQVDFYLPDHRRNESYIELSKNGLELVEDKDYTIEHDAILDKYFVRLINPTLLTDVIHGEIFQADVDKVQEYMTCNKYDSNYDGKVDRAELADSVAGLRMWEPMTSYKENHLILHDGIIYRAIADFGSGLAFDAANWEPILANAIDLKAFTTADLEPDTDRNYVTDEELSDVKTIPTLTADLKTLKADTTASDKNLQTQISKIQGIISSTASTTNKLVDKEQMKTAIEAIKLCDLNDTPSKYKNDAFVKIDATGTGIEYVAGPRFPIMAVTDNKDVTTNDVYDLKIEKYEINSFDGNQLVLSPKLKSTDILDMPAIDRHGALLVSNQTLMQYDLVPADELTISQENFTITISETMWSAVGADHYEHIITHNMDSEALIVTAYNADKEPITSFEYRILDNNSIIVKRATNDVIKVVINCSLGVMNGYWNHIFDLSKITLIDDKNARTDRAYSSALVEKLLDKKAEKTLVYTKAEANNIFSTKAFEHTHSNLKILERFSADSFGNISYNGKKLLTDIKGKTITVSDSFVGSKEIVNTANLIVDNDVSTLLAAEITIQNTSSDVLHLTIKDDDIVLIDEDVPAAGVQKYSLGVSTKIKVIVNGSGKFNYYMSTI